MASTVFVSSRRRSGPDPALVRDQLYWLQSALKVYGVRFFCSEFLWILRKKDEPDLKVTLPSRAWNRRLVPFVFNPVQEDIENRAGKRNIFLKMRQGGYTTYSLCRRLYVPAVTEPGTGSLLISQNHRYAAAHFRIVKRAHKYFGCVDPSNLSSEENLFWRSLHDHLLHVAHSNRHELIFDQLDSQLLCDSAEVEEAGQGLTLHRVVADEVARWPGSPEETLANLKEAIVDDGTLDLVSTANGLGGYYYKECMRARDFLEKNPEFRYFFHQWWWEPGYRADPPAAAESLAEEEKELRHRFKLDLRQIAWRRKKQISQRHNFPEKYPEDDITCFITTGRQFFDSEILATRLRELQAFKPQASYRGGILRILNKKIRNRVYVIGGDVAQGKEVGERESDFSTAVVLDQETGEEMAAYRARVPPEDFAADLAELGTLYNHAMIAPERNGDGGTVILSLQVQHGYGNIYQHREWIRKDQERKVMEFAGFPTNSRTRPIALNKLAAYVREQIDCIWDIQFVEEALHFVRDPKGKPAAEVGAHDDTVMCRAIAHYVRLVNLGYLDPLRSPREKYAEESEEETA